MSTSTAMKRETVVAPSREEWLKLRARDITSTEVSALFGISPYVTPFELWHRKKENQVVEIEPNERMKWGTRLQDAIAAGIAEDQKWAVRPRTQYERLPELRIGASFDFTLKTQEDGDGLLEIKNVDSLAMREDWIVEEEEVEAPPHIEMQVQHQLLVSGLRYAYIGALVGGNRTVLIRREAASDIHDAILSRVEDFWKSVKAGHAPQPDFGRDSAFIAKLYQSVKPGRVYDASQDAEISSIIGAYRDCKARMKEAEALCEEAKARVLMKIGDAEKVIGEGFTITASTVKACHVEAFDRAAYRQFRVNFKKSKES